MATDAYGGLIATAGVGTVALTTTPATLTGWTAKADDNTSDIDGDATIRPDLTNNRILVAAPSVQTPTPPAGLTAATQKKTYQADVDVSGTVATGCDLILQLRKNGSSGTLIAGTKAKNRITTNKGNVGFTAIFSVNGGDFIAAKALGVNQLAFADPSAPDSTHPYFTGQGGAPKNLIPIDVVASCATSTDTLTVEEAHFTIIQLR